MYTSIAAIRNSLLKPYPLNRALELQNCLVMAPMTRCFAFGNIPTLAMADYYEQRASVGLQIGEATMVSVDASGYADTPGIYTSEQVEAWRHICSKVHRKGTKFFLQLWHAGMMSHPIFRNGEIPVSASAIAPKREAVPRTEGKLTYGVAKAMDKIDMATVKNHFITAAINAMEAGCDGVELHAANGYLLDSFLHYSSNLREDCYGSSPENMCRYLLEIVDELIAKIGADRLAVRLSPVPVPSMESIDEDARDQEVFIHLLGELEIRNIAYVHVSSDDDHHDCGQLGMPVSAFMRKHYRGTLIGCGNYDVETGTHAVASGHFDLLAFGRLMIANPNLVDLIRDNESLELKSFEGAMLAKL